MNNKEERKREGEEGAGGLLALALLGIGGAIGGLIAYQQIQKMKEGEEKPDGKGNLVVVVKDTNNIPVKDAVVYLTTKEAYFRLITTHRQQNVIHTAISKNTDYDGRAIFNDLPAQTYNISVSKSGYQTFSDTIKVVKNTTTTKDITLQPTGGTGLVNKIKLQLKWVGNSYPNIPTNSPLYCMNVEVYKYPSREFIAGGITDINGVFSFDYQFSSQSATERIIVITTESVFEPYLPFIIAPSSFILEIKYQSTGVQTFTQVFDEKNCVEVDIYSADTVFGEIATIGTTKKIGDKYYLHTNGNLGIALFSKGYTLAEFQFLSSCVVPFVVKKSGLYQKPFKRSDLEYPDISNDAVYNYASYPYYKDIDRTKPTFWASAIGKQIMPVKIHYDQSTNRTYYIVLFQTAPIKVAKVSEPIYEIFEIQFVSCVYNPVISAYIYKPLKIKDTHLTPFYFTIDSISDFKIRISSPSFHYNPDGGEPYVEQFHNPIQYGYQIIHDGGVIK